MLLVAGCAAGDGCLLAGRIVPGHLVAGLLAACVVLAVAAGYARLSRWLHPVGAAVFLGLRLVSGMYHGPMGTYWHVVLPPLCA